jgi:O-antigen ligase
VRRSLPPVIGAAFWFCSPYLRDRLNQSVVELQAYRSSNAASSTAEYLEFLHESLAIVATVPIIGHGVGSMPDQ